MSRMTRYSLIILVGLIIVIWAFSDELSRYLYDPEGLSLAPGEACVTNAAGGDVIVKISVKNGSTSTTFLASGETACSAAPSDQSEAIVFASREDGIPPFCETNIFAGDTARLTRFDPPSGCEWER